MNTSDKTIHQLNRIRGQIDAIARMYADGRECVEIVRLTIAASNSLKRVARDLLAGEAKQCSRERRVEDLDKLLQEVFKY